MPDTPPVQTDWLTQKEAAGYARSSLNQINAALRAGELVGYQRVANGKWTIHRADLDAWIRGEQPTAASAPVTRPRRVS